MWWLLLACSAGSDVETESESSPPSETDTQVDTGEGWTADEASTQLLSLLAVGLPDAEHVVQSYMALMAQGDETCPGGDGVQMAGSVPVVGCTAESGVFYQGITTYTDIATETETSWVFTADMTLVDADGHEFAAGGTATVISGNDGTLRRSTVAGSFGYEAGERALALGYSAGEFSLVNSEFGVEIDGGIAVGAWAADFSSLLYVADCDGMEGAIDVRSPSGAWWTLTFPEPCTPCGALTDALGQDKGEICLSGTTELPALMRTDLGAGWDDDTGAD